MKKIALKKQQALWIGVLLIALTVFTVMVLVFTQKLNFLTSHASALGNNQEFLNLNPHVGPSDIEAINIPAGAAQRGATVKIPILMYHHIGFMPKGLYDPVRAGLTVSPQDFEQQVQWVASQKFTSVNLDTVYLYSQKKTNLPIKPIVFTFDDGYDDALQYAIPILKKYGYTAAFAIITDFPGTTIGTNTYASWETIVAAKQAGMEIVCHTQNHFDGSNPKYDENFIYNNLQGCQETLTEHLGSAEPFLIYPFGHSTAAYQEQAKKVGFVMGLTVHEGQIINLENLMEIPRVRVSGGENLFDFEKKLAPNNE